MRANQVPRGEAVVLRLPDGDWWVDAAAAAKLQVRLEPSAARNVGADAYYSLRALGATTLGFDEASLTLVVDFPGELLGETRFDLSRRPPPVPRPQDHTSLILSYRLSMRPSVGTVRRSATLQNDINLRVGPLLLRQETRLDSGGATQGFRRGPTQLMWDDLATGTRLVAGDVISGAGPFGSTITGAGVLFSRLFQLTPDVIRQPTATLRTATSQPADVEVSVDGTTLFRGRVPPGPVALENILLYGGTRNLRVTVTDAAGRREVLEQPFLFTDAVLAEGLHDFSYFVGRRSDLVADNRLQYLEPAWQAFHRYGVTNHVTVSAGGEGSRQFAAGGAGAAVRSDSLGLLATELLASRDRTTGTQARGWAGRYTYQLMDSSLQLARRRYGRGFRSFTTGAAAPFLRSETQAAIAARLFNGLASFGISRQADDLGVRTTSFARYSAPLARNLYLVGELLRSRTPTGRQWSANVHLRANLDGDRWASATVTATESTRSVDLSMGQQLPQGDGFGYRAGTLLQRSSLGTSTTAYGSASWNTRHGALDVYGSSQLDGPAASLEAVASGAFVAAGGYWGFTRPVGDGFAVAKLGVPHPGVRISLNNQVQGTTDQDGMLLIPNLGSYGRQTIELDEKALPLEFAISEKKKTFSVPFRGGGVVDFGGRVQRALAGTAWLVRAGQRTPLPARALRLAGPAAIEVETSRSGEFYVENLKPGRYAGEAEFEGRPVRCRLDVPAASDPVHVSEEGLVCE